MKAEPGQSEATPDAPTEKLKTAVEIANAVEIATEAEDLFTSPSKEIQNELEALAILSAQNITADANLQRIAQNLYDQQVIGSGIDARHVVEWYARRARGEAMMPEHKAYLDQLAVLTQQLAKVDGLRIRAHHKQSSLDALAYQIHLKEEVLKCEMQNLVLIKEVLEDLESGYVPGIHVSFPVQLVGWGSSRLGAIERIRWMEGKSIPKLRAEIEAMRAQFRTEFGAG